MPTPLKVVKIPMKVVVNGALKALKALKDLRKTIGVVLKILQMHDLDTCVLGVRHWKSPIDNLIV
jgi:hypothetical protein